MSAKVALKVEEGPMQGPNSVFDEHDTFVYGRAADCHIQMPKEETTLSRHHFILETNVPDAVLRDWAA
jgi:hypothetical protein